MQAVLVHGLAPSELYVPVASGAVCAVTPHVSRDHPPVMMMAMFAKTCSGTRIRRMRFSLSPMNGFM
jgi:hypothetical protein